MKDLELWIARDKDSHLWGFIREPSLIDNERWDIDDTHEAVLLTYIESKFQDVTFENSPQKFRLVKDEPHKL